jgi:hypothetical protein
MNQQDYDNFLQKIDSFINRLENDQDKELKKSEFERIINDLNNAATTKYIDFIKQNPESYNSRIQKLKEALSFDQSLANSVIGVTQSTPTDTTQPATPTTTPLATGTPSQTPTAQNQATPATTPAAAEPAAPDQATLDAAFQKYMGSSFNPNSSMDKGKMETVKKALADFQKQNNNKAFDINDSDDLNKMRPIMNVAYQSEEYKKASGSRPSSGSRSSTPAGGRKQTPAQRTATAPASPKGGSTYYVRTGFNQYRPAVQADITSNQQLFMKNPNRAAAVVYPYVKVDSRPIRRASPVR